MVLRAVGRRIFSDSKLANKTKLKGREKIGKCQGLSKAPLAITIAEVMTVAIVASAREKREGVKNNPARAVKTKE